MLVPDTRTEFTLAVAEGGLGRNTFLISRNSQLTILRHDMRQWLSAALSAPALGFGSAVREQCIGQIAYLLNLDFVRVALPGLVVLAPALWIGLSRH